MIIHVVPTTESWVPRLFLWHASLSSTFAVDQFPENTPKRWEAIALYLEHHCEQNECLTTLQLQTLIMKLAILGVSVSVQRRYWIGIAMQTIGSDTSVLPYSVLIFKSAVHAFVIYTRWKSPLKPLILTQPISTCCDSNIQIRKRPSFPIVYTRNDTFVAASYHGQMSKMQKIILS